MSVLIAVFRTTKSHISQDVLTMLLESRTIKEAFDEARRKVPASLRADTLDIYVDNRLTKTFSIAERRS